MTFRLKHLVSVSLLAAILAVPAAADEAKQAATTQPATRPVVATVTIFNTGDIHEHTTNLARVAAHVKAAKAKDPNVLLLDAGDMVGGYGEKAMGITRGAAMFALLTAMGYDACILGNWEYTLGKDRILELCREYPKFPLIMSNVKWEEDEKDLPKLIPAYKIFQLKGVKVAVIGTGSHDMRYARRRRFAIYQQAAMIHHLMPTLRKEADIVVAVTHQYEGEDYATASGPNAPDLIVGGHSHGAYAHPYGREKKCYIIKPGAYARRLGVVRIEWDGKKIVSCEGSLLNITKDWPEDEEVKALREKFIKDAESKAAPPAKDKAKSSKGGKPAAAAPLSRPGAPFAALAALLTCLWAGPSRP